MRLCPRLSWMNAPTWITMIALVVALSGGVLMTAGSVQAAEVTLAWDANLETDLAGYYLYYRTCDSSVTCTTIGDMGALPRVQLQLNVEIETPSAPRYTLTNLTDDRKYVFVVTAYNQSGSESGPSNTATYTAPPATTPATSYTITASAGSGGSISPQGSVVVDSGANRSFTITPDSGQRIVDVLVDGSSRGPISTYTFNNVTANHTISASFGAANYTISATAGAHGSISPSGDISVSAGSNRIFTMTPASGYRIAGVQVDGNAQGSLSTYTFHSVADNHSIHVDFTLDTLNISATSGAHGSISPSGNVAVPRGDDQTFTITPDSGYQVADVVVDGADMGAVTQYRFSDVQTAHAIYASFAAVNQAPTANAGPDQSTSAGSRVTLDGSRSSDPDDGIATYQWTQTEGPMVILSGDTSANPSFDVPEMGTETNDLTFRLTVTDGHGLSASDTVNIRVDGTNAPPQLAGLDEQSVRLTEALVIEMDFSDPNSQDTHTATINWGDGSPTEGAAIDGQTIGGSHLFISPGEYTATVCVSDQDNATTCAPVAIVVTGEGIPVPILSADFETGTGGFQYADDSFRDTAAPDYADGSHSSDEGYAGGGLKVVLGGIDDVDVYGMSGAWEAGFLLDRATNVTLSLRYNLTQWPAFESDERSELLVQLDDTLVAPAGGDIVAEVVGDGEGGTPLTSGWQTLNLNLGQLAAGAHTLRLGAYNNKKTYNNEVTEAIFDDVALLALLADGGRPTGGFETDHRIPAGQLQYLANGNGQLAIGFKIKDPGSQPCRLHSFQYSIDAGTTWQTPLNGDATGALNTGWQDNQGQLYPSAPTFYSAGTHEIYLNTKHPDLEEMVGLEADTISVRFMINDGDLDSAQALASASFSVSNLGPAIAIRMDAPDPFHVDMGPLTIQVELSESTVTVPNITLIPPSPLSILGPLEMSGDGTLWEYIFQVPGHNGVTVNDGIYQVVVEGVSDLEGNTTRATAHFVTDTRDTDGDGLRDNADSDDDNDGLPDDWELRYGLNPRDNSGVDGRDGDLDGDGLSNWAEYQAGSNPADHLAENDQRPRILAVIPQQGAGIEDDRRVPIASSFCMLLQVPKGLDGTDTSSVQISIYDGQMPYVRDLSDTGVLRLIKLLDEPDNQLTRFWLIYDRSRDGVGLFPFDTEIAISVLLKDRQDQAFADAIYRFSTETEEEHLAAQDEAPATTQLASDDPDLSLEEGYDTGLTVTEGSLAGTKVIYNSGSVITPTVGPINEVPELPAAAGMPLGAPLNLQPPTVSETPVKLLLPCRGVTNEENLTVQIYTGDRWVKAYHADGSVTDDAHGWVAPVQSGIAKVDGQVPMLEVRTYQNTSVQVVEAQDKDNGGDQTVAISCFISSVLSH
jgi:hypothetical protein